MIYKDAHGRTDRGELVGQRRKVGDLVGCHRETIKDLMSSCGVSKRDQGTGCGAYVLNGPVSHQTCAEYFADLHNGGDDDGMGLIYCRVQLKSRALRGLTCRGGVSGMWRKMIYGKQRYLVRLDVSAEPGAERLCELMELRAITGEDGAVDDEGGSAECVEVLSLVFVDEVLLLGLAADVVGRAGLLWDEGVALRMLLGTHCETGGGATCRGEGWVSGR